MTAQEPKRRRGRPRNEDRRNVPDVLIGVTERLLEESGIGALTERNIARQAGVSETVIPYYFGDKNGLLQVLADRAMAFIETTLNSLTEIDPHSPTASRQIAETMIRVHHTTPWIGKLMIYEQQREEGSALWSRFLKRRGPRTLVQIRTVLLRHAAARYPSVTDDPEQANRVALSLLCVTCGTLYFSTMSEPLGIALEDIQREPWQQHVARLVDFHIGQLAGCAVPEQSIKQG